MLENFLTHAKQAGVKNISDISGLIPALQATDAQSMTAPKTAAERQAERKARELAAGRVQWKCWVHPDDLPAIKALAEKLQKKRDKPLTKRTRGLVIGAG